MTKSNALSILTVVLLSTGLLQAQESFNSSGGDITGSGGSVAYSIGQVVYTTNTDISGNVAQGIQNAYEFYSSGIIETELNISLMAFPNPTTENLILQISNYNNEILTYQLFDIQGKLLINGEIGNQITQINTRNIQEATYFLNILNQEAKIVQSFKIIKN